MMDPFFLKALAAGLGLAVVSSPLGCFVVWRRMAYFGETVSQGGLIGVSLALMMSLDVTTTVIVVAVALALLLLGLSRQSVVPTDSILGLLAHATLAVGVVMASLVRGPGIDLMSILFGEIFAVTGRDLAWIFLGGSAALIALISIWRPLLSISVHEDLAAAEGVSVERTRLIFMLVLAVVVAIALKVVGALLTIAFLIMPAAAARPFAETPEQMAFLSVIIAAMSVGLGLFVSVTIDAPAGASIVLVMTTMFAIAMVPLMSNGRD
jgi:zinc transport system permease protein